MTSESEFCPNFTSDRISPGCFMCILYEYLYIRFPRRIFILLIIFYSYSLFFDLVEVSWKLASKYYEYIRVFFIAISLLTPAPTSTVVGLVFHVRVHVLSCLLGRRSLISDQIASTVSLKSRCWRKVCVPCVRVEWIESLRGRPWVRVQCAYDYGVHRCCVLYAWTVRVCVCAVHRRCCAMVRTGSCATRRESWRSRRLGTQLRWTQGSGGHSAHAAYVTLDSCTREQRSSS